MNEERVEINNSCNEKLFGILHQCNHKKELVLICHGFGCNKDIELIKTICENLNQKGFNCFRFDFSGCGESEGDFGDSCYTKQANDLKSIIDYFDEKRYCIQSVIGHSMGGTIAIIQAAKDLRIESVIALAPRIFPLNHSVVKARGKSINELIDEAPIEHCVVENGEEQYKKIDKVYLEDIRDVDVLAMVKEIKIPFLILHGTKDDIVDIKESKKASIIARQYRKKIAQIWGADHMFSKLKHREKMFSKALPWLKKKGKVRRWKPGLIFLLIFSCIFALCSYLLKVPLYLDYALTWAIFALFSMLSLQYVTYTNELKRLLRNKESELTYKSYRKADRAKFFLQWSNLFFIVTVLTLAFRISALSFYPDYQDQKSFVNLDNEPLLWCMLYRADLIMIASFIAGTLLRLVVFVDSYGKDFFYLPWQNPWPFSDEE